MPARSAGPPHRLRRAGGARRFLEIATITLGGQLQAVGDDHLFGVGLDLIQFGQRAAFGDRGAADKTGGGHRDNR